MLFSIYAPFGASVNEKATNRFLNLQNANLDKDTFRKFTLERMIAFAHKQVRSFPAYLLAYYARL